MYSHFRKKYRVRASVYPTNRIIAKSEHGIRQVAFPYGVVMLMNLISFVVVKNEYP